MDCLGRWGGALSLCGFAWVVVVKNAINERLSRLGHRGMRVLEIRSIQMNNAIQT